MFSKFPYDIRLIASLILVLLIAVTVQLSSKTLPVSKQIVDISWPNCREQLTKHYQVGIIGVTGGLAFRTNPCLAQQAPIFGRYALYMNTGYPGPQVKSYYQAAPLKCGKANLECHAFNYGYNAAKYAVNYANKSNAHASVWWLDVETENSWTNDIMFNRAALNGYYEGVKHSPFVATVGIYSYPGQWNLLMGNWHNSLLAWVATGSLNPSAAGKACQSTSFNRGLVWLAQYTNKLDINLPCNSSFINSIFPGATL